MSFINKAREFDSLEDMLNHIGTVIKEAEAAERIQQAEEDDECEINDFDLRRAVVKAVIDHIGFNSPEEFAKYVEFIYGFMVDGAIE